MNFKKLAAGLAVALSLSLVGAAQAQVIRGQDDNIDFLLNSDLTPKTIGSFETGDVLVSVFELPSLTIDGVSQIPADSEVTGIAVIQITGGDGSLATPFTFAPYSGGFNAVSPVDVNDGGAGGGAMVAMWLNSTTGVGGDIDLQLDFAQNPTTNCTSFAQCLQQASLGTLLQVDGFAGDGDEFWISTLAILGGDDVSVVSGTSGSLVVANFNAALTTFFNSIGGGSIAFMDIQSGLACPTGSLAADGCVQGPTLSGPLQGGAGLNAALYDDGAFARSDFNAQKLLAVPEPGTLLLLGIALLGLGALRRRG